MMDCLAELEKLQDEGKLAKIELVDGSVVIARPFTTAEDLSEDPNEDGDEFGYAVFVQTDNGKEYFDQIRESQMVSVTEYTEE